jgi:hypothetical protein
MDLECAEGRHWKDKEDADVCSKKHNGCSNCHEINAETKQALPHKNNKTCPQTGHWIGLSNCSECKEEWCWFRKSLSAKLPELELNEQSKIIAPKSFCNPCINKSNCPYNNDPTVILNEGRGFVRGNLCDRFEELSPSPINALESEKTTKHSTGIKKTKREETKARLLRIILLIIGYIIAFFSETHLNISGIIIGLAICVFGCDLWAIEKDRSWAYMFWGILAPIGFIPMALLKDKSK